MIDWKTITKDLVAKHNKDGWALVSQGVCPVQWVLKDAEAAFASKGKYLSLRPLRTWLYQNRHLPSLQRLPLALWSVYDDEEDQSVVGGAAVLSRDEAKDLQIVEAA